MQNVPEFYVSHPEFRRLSPQIIKNGQKTEISSYEDRCVFLTWKITLELWLYIEVNLFYLDFSEKVKKSLSFQRQLWSGLQTLRMFETGLQALRMFVAFPNEMLVMYLKSIQYFEKENLIAFFGK